MTATDNTTPRTRTAEEQLQNLADLCQRAGESTAWLVPKIETIIMTLAHSRTAEDERADTLGFVDACLKRYVESENAKAQSRVWRGADRSEAMAHATRYIAACIASGDHEGAAKR